MDKEHAGMCNKKNEMIGRYAPIALFVYNRPDHLRRTVSALQKNSLASETDLICYSDGAKTAGDEIAVNEVRHVLNEVTGFHSVIINRAESNMGLADSIISGVTKTINTYNRVIVVEDDIVVNPYFLQYMNDALDTYSDVDEVMHVAGFMPGKHHTAQLPDFFFCVILAAGAGQLGPELGLVSGGRRIFLRIFLMTMR